LPQLLAATIRPGPGGGEGEGDRPLVLAPLLLLASLSVSTLASGLTGVLGEARLLVDNGCDDDGEVLSSTSPLLLGMGTAPGGNPGGGANGAVFKTTRGLTPPCCPSCVLSD
jgi:hypothetical protein